MSRSVRDAMRAGTVRLTEAGVAGAARDARVLLAEALGVAPSRLNLVIDDACALPVEERFSAMLAERARFRPISQIIGRRKFWGREFEVDGNVLDPRPETEILIEHSLKGPVPRSILDLGTGSGPLLVSLLAEWPMAEGVGVDASASALAVARRNADCNGVGARAQFRLGDWLDGIQERFDLVVCNPPYVAMAEMAALSPDVRLWEPQMALTPGETGLEAYAIIAGNLARCMRPAARAIFEIGPTQSDAVSAVFAAVGFGTPQILRDLDGRDRAVVLAA